MLDPTAGIVTETTYNSLLKGNPVKQVFVINPNPDNPIGLNEQFQHNISYALYSGGYLPTDILYYYESLNQALGNGPKDPFITPGGIKWRRRAS